MVLRKVAELVLDGECLDLARNGEHYHLVRVKERDVYGHQIAERVEVPDLFVAEKLQSLLDCLGEALEKLRAHADARERRMTGGQE